MIFPIHFSSKTGALYYHEKQIEYNVCKEYKTLDNLKSKYIKELTDLTRDLEYFIDNMKEKDADLQVYGEMMDKYSTLKYFLR
jgi:hypothetical protein